MSEQPTALGSEDQAPKIARVRKGLPPSPEANLLREISAKLDRVIAVLATQGKEREKQIEILAAAGCDSNFIGVVVGMTGVAVRKFQSRQRAREVRSATAAETPAKAD